MPAAAPGPIVLQSDVEIAVRDTLKEWVPFYLADIDEQQGRQRGTTKAPRLWDIASENATRWREETPPSLLVVCPGTVDDPKMHGDDAAYGAWFRVSIVVAAAGATEEGSRAVAGRHAGAILYTLAQQGDMGGLAQHTRWLGYGDAPSPRDRSVTEVEVLARVYVARVVSTRGLLPRERPDDPTQPAPHTPTPSAVRVRVPLPQRP